MLSDILIKIDEALLSKDKDAYVFMNVETLNEILSLSYTTFVTEPIVLWRDGYRYRGHKIFIDSDLDYEEIEVR